ncbi:hypothetical protein [Streptomyces sp. NPDC059168]|uniref:hypothetical protein n=1 Tax=Streptomyces sp. NPDC059168 TaxID=3346753 RepID=UPI0036A99674
MVIDEAAATAWWEGLPAGLRDEVDGYVLQDSFLKAVRILWEIGRDDGVGLNDAQDIVSHRYRHYQDRIARTPHSPLDLESLARRAAGCPGRVVAIEAIWDGDTVHDWFVRLLALTVAPEEERALATVYWSGAEQYLGEDEAASRWHPSAAAAERAGRALADHLSVPFHFASPDTPDDEAPRWRP